MADVQQQLGIGQLTQGQNQQALDLAYQQFAEQRQHPKDQLSFLAGIMNLDPNKNAMTQQRWYHNLAFLKKH